MNSADIKNYPCVACEPGTFGSPDPHDRAKLIVLTSHPVPVQASRRRPLSVETPRGLLVEQITLRVGFAPILK